MGISEIEGREDPVIGIRIARPCPIEFARQGDRLAMGEGGRLIGPQRLPHGLQVGRDLHLPQLYHSGISGAQ